MPRNIKQMPRRALSHWRLAAAFAVGIVVWIATNYFAAPRGARLLLAWDSAALAYLALMWTLFIRSREAEMRSRAGRYDEGVPVLMLIVLAAIAVSLGAVVDAMIVAIDASIHCIATQFRPRYSAF